MPSASQRISSARIKPMFGRRAPLAKTREPGFAVRCRSILRGLSMNQTSCWLGKIGTRRLGIPTPPARPSRSTSVKNAPVSQNPIAPPTNAGAAIPDAAAPAPVAWRLVGPRHDNPRTRRASISPAGLLAHGASWTVASMIDPAATQARASRGHARCARSVRSVRSVRCGAARCARPPSRLDPKASSRAVVPGAEPHMPMSVIAHVVLTQATIRTAFAIHRVGLLDRQVGSGTVVTRRAAGRGKRRLGSHLSRMKSTADR